MRQSFANSTTFRHALMVACMAGVVVISNSIVGGHAAPPEADAATQPAAPALMASCDITRWIEALQAEAAAIVAQHRTASEPELAAARSRANLRMLIADLLLFADPSIRTATPDASSALDAPPAPPAGTVTPEDDQAARDHACLAACTLLAALPSIDTALTANDSLAAAHAHLHQFNDGMIGLVRSALPAEPDVLEERLRSTVAPLAMAMEALAPAGDRTNAFVSLEPPDDEHGIDGLGHRLAALNLDEAGRIAGTTVLDYLLRAAAFPELLNQVRPVADALVALVELSEASASATWLRDADRAAIENRVSAVLSRLADPTNRAEALAKAAHIRELAKCVRRITEARALDMDMREVADALLSAAGFRRAEPRARQDASRRDAPAGHTAQTDGATLSVAGIAMLNAAIDRMIAMRSLRDVRLHRDLRETWRDRLVQARSAERALVNSLPDLLASPNPMADPSQASAILAHVDALDDLARLTRVPTWLEAIERVHTRSIEGVEQEIRRRMRPLGDPAHRVAAADWSDRFNDRAAPLMTHAFEEPLRAGGSAVLELCGGRHADVLNALDADRRTFAADLVRNDDAEPPARLALLAELLNALQACTPIFEQPTRAARLNLHPCWELPAPVMDRLTTHLRTRLRLAATAAADADIDALTAHLGQVQKDVPLIRLVITLESQLAHQHAANVPESVVDLSRRLALHELIDAQPLSSHLAAQRRAIEHALNLTLKREHALADGRTNDADRLGLQLSRSIDSVLARLAKSD